MANRMDSSVPEGVKEGCQGLRFTFTSRVFGSSQGVVVRSIGIRAFCVDETWSFQGPFSTSMIVSGSVCYIVSRGCSPQSGTVDAHKKIVTLFEREFINPRLSVANMY